MYRLLDLEAVKNRQKTALSTFIIDDWMQLPVIVNITAM